eukprot:TRINITY_DN50838_c0_g1_i1.p1 TRINITY_DN50838_c0_g1~~TRINITY_DN50838_c0_g1_i1.p1  ORF type:complete len:314 (+),score=89.68 TRINITY_DN50838_c0_g1_i1:29-943(+)
MRCLLALCAFSLVPPCISQANPEWLKELLNGDQVNPYEVLNVSRTADAKEIKRAFLHGARKEHPDRNPKNPKAAEKRFRKLAASYEILKDPERRQYYDTFGRFDDPQFEEMAKQFNLTRIMSEVFGDGMQNFTKLQDFADLGRRMGEKFSPEFREHLAQGLSKDPDKVKDFKESFSAFQDVIQDFDSRPAAKKAGKGGKGGITDNPMEALEAMEKLTESLSALSGGKGGKNNQMETLTKLVEQAKSTYKGDPDKLTAEIEQMREAMAKNGFGKLADGLEQADTKKDKKQKKKSQKVAKNKQGEL